MKYYLKNIFLAASCLWLFTACNDFLTLYPEDDIVDDEYWACRPNTNLSSVRRSSISTADNRCDSKTEICIYESKQRGRPKRSPSLLPGTPSP